MTTPDPVILAGQTIGSYVIVHSNGAKEPVGQPAEPLGTPGDTGVVYRAVFKDQQHRAVKFISADSSSSKTKAAISSVSRGFYRERIFLTWLTHGNIVRFHDAGLHKMEPDDREYIVTEFISGKENFREELNSDDVSGEECYKLIGEVLRALIYMHSVGVGHGSVKFETIRCRTVGRERQAVLLDLASAQPFGDTPGSTEASRIADALAQSEHALNPRDGIMNQGSVDVVPFRADRRITHRETLEYLQQRGSRPKDIFPYHDLHSVGILLEDLLDPELTIRAKLQAHLLGSGLDALDMIVKWLLSGPLDCPYKTMKQLYNDWDKLRHSYLAPAEVPELSIAAEFKYSMATPIGRVVITTRLSRLMEHVLFQRLRDMPQLELVNLRYPGATHTRQQHAIVRLRNTRYYLAHLLNGPFFRLMTNKAELQATLVLALLQGVGHYQLSHFFEDYAAEQRTRKRQGNLTGMWSQLEFDIPTDRDLFPSVFNWNEPGLLRGNYSEVIKQCCANKSRKLSMPQSETLADVTARAFDAATRDAVTAIFNAAYRPALAEAQSHSHFVLAAVLKSEIDADKISYLMEDAVETGVHFGEGIDLDGLLGALRAPSLCDIEEADGPILGITEKGLAAVESVLNIRNEMYERVYWHHSTRAIAAMIKYCITRLLASGRFDMPDFVKETFFMSSDAEALRALWERYEKIRQRQSVNPISNLLFGERGIYKEVRVLEPGDDQNWSVEETAKMEDILTDLIGESIRDSNVRRGEVVIDVPIAERGMAEEGRESLYVYEGNTYEAGRALGEFTASAVAKVRDVHRQRGRRCRVFASRPLLSRVGSEAINEVITEWTRHGSAMYDGSWG